MAPESSSDFELTVTDADRIEFNRLDVYLTARIPELSRSTIKRLFEHNEITSSIKLSLNKMPPTGTLIEIDIPPPVPSDLTAENIPLEILYEDEFLIIINKPAGLVVHPAPGHYTGTLVNAILHHCPDLKGIGAEKRPGIVHRLDMGTSGVMVVAKEQKTHEGLVGLFSTHDIERRYEALIAGQPRDLTGKIETMIGRHPQNRLKMAVNAKIGKRAVTHYSVIKKYQSCTHMELKLETGRTHQIRVHLASVLHTPILCDTLYGAGESHIKKLPEEIRNRLSGYPFQLLHAKVLGFKHPMTGVQLHFTSPPPDIFQDVLQSLHAYPL